tara:strand:+ start:202 stop:459 length:258 start_codon:yes stop_codon:yes gene_type:complete
MNIKTETKTVTTYKVGLYMDMEELNTCINALTNFDAKPEERLLARDLVKIQTKAKENIENLKSNVVSEEEVLNSNQPNCAGGNCD